VFDARREIATGVNASMDQPPLPEIEPYINRNLFSDHFLKELLPQDESWKVDEDKLKLAMQAATNLYAGREEEWAQSNEPQLENRLVRPMLQALDHKFEVQPSLPTPEAVRRPDYAFFATDEERLRAKREHNGETAYFTNAIAIGDAKRWDRSLDKKERSGRDSFDMLSPSWQIDYYLRMSGVKWGILTNGRLWRLYNQETSFRLDICYEIDLPRLLAAQDLEAFKYFYLFFRREAFVADAEGLCFLDRVYQGSLEYAQAVGDDLKENVYKALRLLAEGFLRTRGNDLDPVRGLDEIHANSLVLLYRLLFINYAEDRGLLPRDNALYKESYGLVSMEREIASRLQRGDSLSPLHTTYWGKLKTLFELISRGTEGLGVEAETMDVPPYNGGLFDPKKHPFLEQHQVADKWVSQVADLLARSQGKGLGRGFVDYSSLDVRHLGSIYEGLLEYKLRVADEEMVAVKRGGKEQWIPATETGSSRVLERVQPGSVYLTTDRGERKATGSYYTPDYIVKYIVEHTVGPLIEEKMKDDDPIEGILSLKVLDPAMGSGHFLVEATDRLAHALVQALGVTEQEPEEEDIRWARREVVERCIYGVDLNPLAVELAKLGLWLHTVAQGKPLNFLDHHLKVGNSLIGAWVDDLGSLPAVKKGRVTKASTSEARQMNIFEIRLNSLLPTMLSKMLEIFRRRSETLDDIKAKAGADEAIKKLRAPFKAVADLWVSTYFGNEVRQAEYQEALEHIGRRDELFALPCVMRAREIVQNQAFFHWELQFPELFYEDSSRRDNAGFDAVVGNPPYLGTREMSRRGLEQEKQYFRLRFAAAHKGFDLYIPFMERGLALTAVGGRFGFIVPNKFWVTDYGERMVSLLTTKYALLLVADVSSLPVFPDAAVYPHVVIARRRIDKDIAPEVLLRRGFQDPSELARDGRSTVVREENLVSSLHGGIRMASKTPTFPLGEVSRVRAGTTGFLASAMAGCLQDGKPSDVTRCVPFIVTGNIDRYEIVDRPVRYMGRTYQSPSCVFSPAVISDAKWRLFCSPKLIVAGMTTRLESAYDATGVALGVNVYAITEWAVSAQYLLAILNSAYASYLYRSMFESKHLAGGYLAINKGQLEKVPIRAIVFTTPKEERAQLREQAGVLYEAADQAALLAFTDGLLASKPEQGDAVHDLLGYLAQEMMEMNEKKQEERAGFLDWLEDYTCLPVEEWRLKTVVGAYWEQGWDEFQRALRQNRKALEQASGRNVESREAKESIRGEFDKSTAKLDPLLKRIASTDRLIDLIVYRLYGLTEEEVAIVEESATT